jgi:hypothetical protein
LREQLGVQRHLDVGGEHGDEQHHDAEAREPTQAGCEQGEGQRDLGEAGQVHQQHGCRQPARDPSRHLLVEQEVVDALQHQDDAEQAAKEPADPGVGDHVEERTCARPETDRWNRRGRGIDVPRGRGAGA